MSAIWILLIGVTILAAAAVDSTAHHARIPKVVGYLGIGLLLGLADTRWAMLGDEGRHAFELLADLGIVVLLFRVGLHSHLQRLVEKLRPAAPIWLGNVVLSGAAGFVAARYLAGLTLPGSLLVATALTATSVGVAAAAWASHDALDTPDGDLMLDVAELDDLSAVLLMAIVLALVSTPEPLDGWLPSLIAAGSSFAIKFAAFGGLCYLFAKYVEEPLTRFAAARKRAPQRMLIVAGAAFVIAAVAEWLEFSLAIGALFAGLMFSRDPQAVRTEAGFDDIHDFLMPFFFVGIGLTTDLGSIGNAWMLGAVFLAVAVTGKILGAALPALLVTTKRSALLIGFSMVPRAEIALVIAYHGLALGLLDQRTYAAMVLVSIATCIVATWLLEALLGRPDDS